MRIIAGKFKGLKLNEFQLNNIRPTIDRVREAIFSKIQFQIQNANVLDLFGGTGAISLEFVSRGAKSVVTVDNNKDSSKLIRQNFRKANATPNLLEMDYMTALQKFKKENNIFDIIFLDPPFMTDYAQKSINFIADNGLLSEDGIIVFEHSDKEPLLVPDNFELIDEKKYGTIKVSYLECNNG